MVADVLAARTDQLRQSLDQTTAAHAVLADGLWSVLAAATPLGFDLRSFVRVRALARSGAAADWLSVIVAIRCWFPARVRGRDDPILLGGLHLGPITAAPLTTRVSAAFSWRWAFCDDDALAWGGFPRPSGATGAHHPWGGRPDRRGRRAPCAANPSGRLRALPGRRTVLHDQDAVGRPGGGSELLRNLAAN
jgi:MFS family permease